MKLKTVSIYDKVVIQDNEIELLWSVKGCHKIKINGLGVFLGNLHGLKFFFSNGSRPIEITFYGIGRKLKKEISVTNYKINLSEKFIVDTKIPIAIEVPYNKSNIECELSKDHLKMELENIFLNSTPLKLTITNQ